MVNLTRISFLMILMFWTTESTGAAFSIEEEILQLKLKMTQLEAKDAKMEGKNEKMEKKVTELESKNVQMQEKVNKMEEEIIELKLKDAEMQEKVMQLETKVKEQENILTFLSKSAELLDQKSILNKLEDAIESTGRSGTARTCRELRAANPTLSSGMQWIDPDGQGVGDGPIYVYCDMTTGSTSILHDSEIPIDVGHCADAGCYSRAINYNVSMKQMESLIALSAECHQSIKYDCYYAPFEFNGVAYSWWNDRNGNAQYFWAGNNTDGVHTCQCGINGNCVDNSFKCNCDISLPIQLADDGFITDKNVLPVTRLNFGRTLVELSSGIYTLGRFECTGAVAITGFPTSCEDLLLFGHTLNGLYLVMEGGLVKNIYCDFTKFSIDEGFQSLIGYAEVKPKPTYLGMPTSCANLKGAGHTSSGFYSVKGTKMIESVFCDFTKTTSAAGFQKWIGYADVKSAPVHFYVQRNYDFVTQYTPIPFDFARVNDGNAMNLATGKFTAPRSGTYFFSFTGQIYFTATTHGSLRVALYLNGGLIGSGRNDEKNDINGPFTLQSTLNLAKDDQVWLQICETKTSAYLTDNGNHYTHFTGFMLEEEIVASLL